MVINSPCLTDKKELASPKQTAIGKDFSNPLIAGRLLKTAWESIHHVFNNEELASPKQTAIGKDFTNPLIADSLLKTIRLSMHLVIDTALVKTVNGVPQLQALIDGKKVVVTEDIIRRDLHLDDAARVKCLPNEEIFEHLARIGYTKPPPKLTFYKEFFSSQWKFLIHTILQCLSAKKTS
ncbi:hypothetical protein Tco_0944418 [Tanacetum coccineum]